MPAVFVDREPAKDQARAQPDSRPDRFVVEQCTDQQCGHRCDQCDQRNPFGVQGFQQIKVQWKTEIPEYGEYDIYYNIPFSEQDILNASESKIFNDLNFIIYHDNSTENVKLDIINTKPGWAYLGTYTLSQGITRIELSDKSKGRIVYADAVKWVEQK